MFISTDGNFRKLMLGVVLLIAGYFSNPEATTSTLDSSGWLRTGDLCYIDDDGFIFIVDRLKELIKYKGYQVKGTFIYSFFQVGLRLQLNC